jgi:hypothetical protein
LGNFKNLKEARLDQIIYASVRDISSWSGRGREKKNNTTGIRYRPRAGKKKGDRE